MAGSPCYKCPIDVTPNIFFTPKKNLCIESAANRQPDCSNSHDANKRQTERIMGLKIMREHQKKKTMNATKNRALFIFLLAVTIISSCRKQPDFDQLSSNFVVSTSYDKAISFTNYKTFYISDSISYISSTVKNIDTIVYNDASKQLAATVKTNMAALGYTFVSKASHPDLGLNMGAVKNVNAGVVSPGWWWGYPGWWDPYYWGWDYPYYYPWSYVYYVTTGSIIIDMVDLKNAGADQKLNVIWNTTSGGALGSDLNSNVQKGVDAINQAFKQSPQLKTK